MRGIPLRSWLASKFVTHPLGAVAAVCLAFVAVALALGTFVPWPFLQNVAADFVGGLVAGLLIFYLANIAFGFTERRKKQRHALRTAYAILLPELGDNLSELRRIVKVLEERSLTERDPVFWEAERLKAETWQQLVQSPLVALLDPDLLWTINVSYYSSRRFVKELKESGPQKFARSPEGYKELCNDHLPRFKTALHSILLALDALTDAQDGMSRV